jgi:pyoverdine/dityrosine biosynthesis protein Dit1
MTAILISHFIYVEKIFIVLFRQKYKTRSNKVESVMKLDRSSNFSHDSLLEKKIETSKDIEDMAVRILMEFLKFRRVPRKSHSCSDLHCRPCLAPHLKKIMSSLKINAPIIFVLPAFPGKSPNLEKVLGFLPDYAEQLSLKFLGSLCQKIKEYYAPGIKIVLCSDGRVFSDVIGIKENHITDYQSEMKRLVKEMFLNDILIYNLDDFYIDLRFSQMRSELVKCYGYSLEFLKHKIAKGSHHTATADEKEAHRMYCGMTRFLFEDSLYDGQTKTRSRLQKESRIKAQEVLVRSHAWSELISEYFPQAIRLSIHPQECGSKKLGIRLVANESWMTPWHGVIMETTSGYILLKRSEAEALGGELVYFPNGYPSHYRMPMGKDLKINGEII